MRITTGDQITIEINCRAYKDTVTGVPLTVKGHPEIKLGVYRAKEEYIVTELNTGGMVFICPEKANYLQVVINYIDRIIDAMQTEYYRQQVERMKMIPFKRDWEAMWVELGTIFEIPDFKDCCRHRLSAYNILDLVTLEEEIYSRYRVGFETREQLFGGASFRDYIFTKFGERAVRLVEGLSSHL